MRLQDGVCRYTEDAITGLYRAVARVPADKLGWKPMDGGRTILDQLQECAQSPLWYLGYLDPTFHHGFNSLEELWESRRELKTTEECERVTRENTAKFVEQIRNLADEDLEKPQQMPWGETMSLFDVISFQYWNLVYHTGQINYIQTLYGDKEM